MNTVSNEQDAGLAEKTKSPDWTVKTPKGYGRRQRLERVGAAWNREDGGICLRLSGTQIVTEDLYLYPVEAGTEA